MNTNEYENEYENMVEKVVGAKGDIAYKNSGEALVDFFSKAGSFTPQKESFHGETLDVIELFKNAWSSNKYKAMQLIMWMRDARGGAGSRENFRKVIRYVAESNPEWVEKNISLIPEVGRWDDLISLMDTSCESLAVEFWLEAIVKGNGLAAKWAPREKNNKVVFGKMRKASGLSPKEYRKLLVKNTNVVETKMCAKKWNEIDFNKVPSVAMARSANAFEKHEDERYKEWRASLSKPESINKVNASVLYPHDCIRTMWAELSSNGRGGFYSWSVGKSNGQEMYCDGELANAQFAALPDYMDGCNSRIMCIPDFSGSMCTPVSGSVKAIDVAMGLALYCSDRIGKDNPYYRQFIPFSTDAHYVNWKEDSFSVAAQKYNDGYCGSTNIRAALNKILESAKICHATNEQMPNCLMIISDMQWDIGSSSNMTSVEAGIEAWEKAGYNRPKIIYWNLVKYSDSPSTIFHKDVAMVSGFSPSLMKAVLAGDDFTPLGVMERAIEKYKVVDPTI